MGKEKTSGFIGGVLFAIQELVLTYDEPSYAAEIVAATGFSKEEFLNAQFANGHGDKEMVMFFETEAFKEIRDAK